MNYYMGLMGFFLGVLSLLLLWQAVRYWRGMRLWKRLEKTPWPPAYLAILERLPHFRALPPPLCEKVRPKTLYFAHTKEFRGVGVEVSDEMRAVISFFACLMVLEIPDECYERLETILIYPEEVLYRHEVEEGGIVTEEETTLDGQSSGDTVVIVWKEALHEALRPHGYNVIVHEMAHVLDAEDGVVDGVPPMEPSTAGRWGRVLYRRFRELVHERPGALSEAYRILGEYAATDEAEFFAVASERFFADPLKLKEAFGDIYESLRSYYGLDTAKLFATLG